MSTHGLNLYMCTQPARFTRYLLYFADSHYLQCVHKKTEPTNCRAMLCISAAYAVMRCLSVCPSVTFVDHVETNKHIFEIFSWSGSHTILVFPYQTGWRYSDGSPPNGGVECRWGRQKRDSGRISGFAAYRSTVLSTVRVAKCEKQSHVDERRQASSTHCGVRHLLFTQENDEVYVTGSMLYAGDEGRSNPPLVITPVFCCCRTS